MVSLNLKLHNYETANFFFKPYCAHNGCNIH